MAIRMWIGAVMMLGLVLALASAVRAEGGEAADAGEGASADAVGKVMSLIVGGQPFDLEVAFAIHSAGWKSSASPNAWSDHGARMRRLPDGWEWTGRLHEGGAEFDWSERLTDEPNGAKLAYQFVPETKPAIEGVFVTVSVPVEDFAGGSCAPAAEKAEGAAATEPAPVALWKDAPADQEHRHLGAVAGKTFVFTSADGKRTLRVALNRPVQATVQDARVWGHAQYELMIPVVGQNAGANEPATLELTLAGEQVVDRAPVTLTLGAADEAHVLKGLGGNYCFDIQSPVVRYTLDHLPSAWARHEIRMTQWKPRYAGDKDARTNEQRLAAADGAGSELHAGFVVAQELAKRGVPLIFTLWRPGAPFFVSQQQKEAKGTIAPEQWPYLLDAMVDYTRYAQAKYGVEAALISTNESDYGVDVKLTPEEEKKFVLDMGERLERAGLKTKVLLGDVASLRGGTTFVLPTIADAGALKYVGAVAYHAWGDGTELEYAAWRKAADEANKPLLVTEFGADANWRAVFTRGATLDYALEESRMLLQALAWSRPETVLYWEYTGDYALVRPGQDGANAAWAKRAECWRQVAALTPAGSVPRAVEGEGTRVMAAAYAGPKGSAAVHVVNRGAQRQLTLRGLPAGVTTLHEYVTDATRGMTRVGDLTVQGGAAELAMPARALVTLTTQTLPE